MTSSSEQDNMDYSLDEEVHNSYSNTQNGTQKRCTSDPLPPLQPVTPSNLTNLNLAKLLALL